MKSNYMYVMKGLFPKAVYHIPYSSLALAEGLDVVKCLFTS